MKEENYTDKIINELTKREYNYSDSIKLIREKYRLRGFTLIGIKKEKRYLQRQVSENTCNTFDVISGINTSVLSGVIVFAILKSFKNMPFAFKILFPIIITIGLIFIFLEKVSESREKVAKYTICLDVLDEIQDKLEGDCLVALSREIVEEELDSRCNKEGSSEIDLEIETVDENMEAISEEDLDSNIETDVVILEDDSIEEDVDVSA